MIQRQQSLWLLLVAVCAFLSFKFPFFAGGSSNAMATVGGAIYIDAGSSLFAEIKTSAGAIALSSVFAFVMPLAYIMAARGIYKDQKLIKSLNKLR